MATATAFPQPLSYQAHDRESLLSEVAGAICVLQPRGLIIAGMAEGGEALIVRQYSGDKFQQEWSPEFFEHYFTTEPLLGGPQPVMAVAIDVEAGLLVPNALYHADEAADWLRSIHSLLPTDTVIANSCEADALQYVYALPDTVRRLLAQYFSKAPVMPIGGFQFYKPGGIHGVSLQGVLSNGQAIATLRMGGRLQWHQRFEAGNGQEFAWHVFHLCRQLRVAPIDVQVSLCSTCPDDAAMLDEIEAFFPKFSRSNSRHPEEGAWSPLISLLQQLYACAL